MVGLWGCCVPSPGVPWHNVSLFQAGETAHLSATFPSVISATSRTSITAENFQIPSLAMFLQHENKSLLDTRFPAVPGIKVSVENLNHYLNYTAHLGLQIILQMFHHLICLQFLSKRNMGIYPKITDLGDLVSKPLSFCNDFQFCHRCCAQLSVLEKPYFKTYSVAVKKCGLLATLWVTHALLEVQSRWSDWQDYGTQLRKPRAHASHQSKTHELCNPTHIQQPLSLAQPRWRHLLRPGELHWFIITIKPWKHQ